MLDFHSLSASLDANDVARRARINLHVRLAGGILLLLFLVLSLYAKNGAGQSRADIPVTERRVLMEFFDATGGDRWTHHDGWGTTRPACDWYGVQCTFLGGKANRPVVASIDLADNNLRGVLPASLSSMPHLQSLDVAGNHLTGVMPETLLRRWDRHAFEFNGSGNAFSNFVVRTVIEYSASGTLCAADSDVRFRIELDGVTDRATFQTVRCANSDVQSRQTYCLVRTGTPPSLERFSRALAGLRFGTFESKYDFPFTALTHAEFITTTAVWGDGSTKAVETYARQGPRDVWLAQQLFLGLAFEATWNGESRAPKCSFEH
jgi:hypothetical protein